MMRSIVVSAFLVAHATALGFIDVPNSEGSGVNPNGYLRHLEAELFLACTHSNCQFVDDSDQATKLEQLDMGGGTYKFRATWGDANGDYVGFCLKADFDKKKAYLSSAACGKAEGKQWHFSSDGEISQIMYLPGKNVKLCIKSDGKLSHNNCQSIMWQFETPIGFWDQIMSVTSGVITNSVTWGVTSTDARSTTTTWQESASASLSKGFIFQNGGVSGTTSHSVATMMSQTLATSVTDTCQVQCPADPDKPWIFLHQWVNTFTQFPNTYSNPALTTEARSCNYMCIYAASSTPIVPQCPLTCCGSDTTCQECDPACDLLSPTAEPTTA